MQGAPTRRIAEVVNKCPTQAIVWKYNKDLTDEERQAQRTEESVEENPETITTQDTLSQTKPVKLSFTVPSTFLVNRGFGQATPFPKLPSHPVAYDTVSPVFATGA